MLQDSWSLGLLVLETKWTCEELCLESPCSFVSGIFRGESALSPLMWTRGEKGTSVSRAELRSDRHSHFFE